MCGFLVLSLHILRKQITSSKPFDYLQRAYNALIYTLLNVPLSQRAQSKSFIT